MAFVLVRHHVSDYNGWRRVFDENLDFRHRGGEEVARVFRSADDPNQLTLLVQFDTREHARRFMTSDTLRAAMQRAGVEGKLELEFVDEVLPMRRTASD